MIEKMKATQLSSNHTPLKCKGGSGTYHVIQCGLAGHNIRSRAGIKGSSPPLNGSVFLICVHADISG